MILRRRKSIRGDQPGAIASQLLGLSLFVMLLAFFIVLNSISSFDEAKVSPMRQSLEETFVAMIPDDGIMKSSITKSLDMATSDGSTLEQIEGLFKSHIAGMESVTSMRDGTLYIRLKKADFETAVNALGDTKGPKVAQDFLKVLVSVLRSEQRGTPYRIEIIYNIDDNPARIGNREPGKMAAMVKAVAAMAGKIEAAGLPQKLMTVGLQKGDPEYVELLFIRHVAFDPRGAHGQ